MEIEDLSSRPQIVVRDGEEEELYTLADIIPTLNCFILFDRLH